MNSNLQTHALPLGFGEKTMTVTSPELKIQNLLMLYNLKGVTK